MARPLSRTVQLTKPAADGAVVVAGKTEVRDAQSWPYQSILERSLSSGRLFCSIENRKISLVFVWKINFSSPELIYELFMCELL